MVDMVNMAGMVDVFEWAWELYPRHRSQGNSAAKQAFMARVAEGVDPGDLVHGVIRYAWHCLCKETPIQYVKHAGTFFGSKGGRPWEDDYGYEDDPTMTCKMTDDGGEMIEWRRRDDEVIPVKANKYAKPMSLEDVLTKSGHPPAEKVAS